MILMHSLLIAPFLRFLALTVMSSLLALGLLHPLPAWADVSAPSFDQSGDDQAHAIADALRGKVYQDGVSLRHDYAEAARLYRSAASRGLALGQYYLGLLYVADRHVEGRRRIEELAPAGRAVLSA